MMLREDYTKLSLRMTKKGEISEEFLSHKSAEAGFLIFDVFGDLLYTTDVFERKEATKIVDGIRLRILKAGTWGDNKATRKLLTGD